MSPDGGEAFGTWPDETSRLMYRDAMPALLAGTDTSGMTLDLGGGNALAREWFYFLTTVDNDGTKRPHVRADIRTYVPDRPYDRVLLRYVLHYLSDEEVRALMAHVASYHRGELTVVQFVHTTDVDLEAKVHNSVNERKWFRTEAELVDLLAPWVPFHRVAVEYDVVPEFYRNRLGHTHPVGHRETVVSFDCKVSAP